MAVKLSKYPQREELDRWAKEQVAKAKIPPPRRRRRSTWPLGLGGALYVIRHFTHH